MTEDNRSITQYLKAKLGITTKIYCELEGIKDNGLFKAWNTPTGKRRIKERVFRWWMVAEYPKGVKLYDDL